MRDAVPKFSAADEALAHFCTHVRRCWGDAVDLRAVQGGAPSAFGPGVAW